MKYVKTCCDYGQYGRNRSNDGFNLWQNVLNNIK